MTIKIIVSILLTIVFGGLVVFAYDMLKNLGAILAAEGLIIGYYLLFMYLTWTK